MRTDLPALSVYANSDDEKNKRKQLIYDMFATKKFSWGKIQKLTGLSRSTIFNVRQTLIADGKLVMNDKGHIVKTPQQRREEESADLSASEFVQNHECIKTLADAYKNSPHPKAHVSAMYIICKTISTPPEAFLVSTLDTTRLYNDFVEKFSKGEAAYLSTQKQVVSSDTSYRRYTAALRQFLRVNDRPLPAKMDGNLSGKKENYGAYSTVQLSDQQYLHGLKFFSEIDDGHNDDWRAWFALAHDAFPRPASLDSHILNLQVQQKYADGAILSYLSDSMFESKTQKHFPKWIFRKESVDVLQNVSNNHRILNHIQSKIAEKSAGLLRQFYASEKLIELDQKYRKVVDGEKYYMATKPRHTLRHSGCHFLMRSSGNNVATVALFGWDDLSMITQVYASTSVDSILDEGNCNFCNPPKIQIPDSNLMFCSLRHAITYHSNNCQTKEQMHL